MSFTNRGEAKAYRERDKTLYDMLRALDLLVSEAGIEGRPVPEWIHKTLIKARSLGLHNLVM